MKALELEEFAVNLRIGGDWRESDFGTEILELIDMRKDVEEPYHELCETLDWSAPADMQGKPEKALERLCDRSDLLEEIEKQLDEDGRTGDYDDQVKALLSVLSQARDIIGSPDGCSDEEFLQELEAFAERAKPKEYDL